MYRRACVYLACLKELLMMYGQIMDARRLKEELSIDSFRKSSHANAEKGRRICAKYAKNILEII